MLFSLPMHLLYLKLFRPILITRLRYGIFKARDELLMMALHNQISQNERAFPILERSCNNCLRVMGKVDLVDLLNHSKSIDLQVEEDLRIINESGPKLRRVFSDIHTALVGAVFANSPGIFIFVIPLAVLGIAFYWFMRTKSFLDGANKKLWGALYSDYSVVKC